MRVSSAAFRRASSSAFLFAASISDRRRSSSASAFFSSSSSLRRLSPATVASFAGLAFDLRSSSAARSAGNCLTSAGGRLISGGVCLEMDGLSLRNAWRALARCSSRHWITRPEAGQRPCVGSTHPERRAFRRRRCGYRAISLFGRRILGALKAVAP